jgi:hypothetical protein
MWDCQERISRGDRKLRLNMRFVRFFAKDAYIQHGGRRKHTL